MMNDERGSKKLFNSSFIIHHSSFLLLARSDDCFKNFHIARAATKIARKSGANLCFVWIGRSLQKIDGGDDHARRADAALRAAAGDECFLNGVEWFTACNTFDSFNQRSFDF